MKGASMLKEGLWGLLRLLVIVSFVVIAGVSIVNFLGARGGRGVMVETLQNRGFNNVVITNTSSFLVAYRGCGRGTSARYHAYVTDSQGSSLEIEVCTDWFRDIFRSWLMKEPEIRFK